MFDVWKNTALNDIYMTILEWWNDSIWRFMAKLEFSLWHAHLAAYKYMFSSNENSFSLKWNVYLGLFKWCLLCHLCYTKCGIIIKNRYIYYHVSIKVTSSVAGYWSVANLNYSSWNCLWNFYKLVKNFFTN